MINASALVGMDMGVVTPPGYEPDEGIVQEAKEKAMEGKAKITIGNELEGIVEGSDIIYTDVWTSMGQEEETQARLKVFKGYQINSDVMKMVKEDALVMHCLPAHRGEEITAEVLDGPNSIIFDQAENRLHAQKGLLAALL